MDFYQPFFTILTVFSCPSSSFLAIERLWLIEQYSLILLNATGRQTINQTILSRNWPTTSSDSSLLRSDSNGLVRVQESRDTWSNTSGPNEYRGILLFET